MLLYYFLVVTLPLMNERFLAHPLLGFTVEKWLGLACFFFAVVDWAIHRRPAAPFASAQTRAFLVFYLLALVSFSTIPTHAPASMMLVYTSHLLFLLTTLLLVRTVERLRWAMLAAVGAMTIASLFVIREWLAGSALYGLSFRPGYVLGDANYFTASILVVLPFAFYVFTERRVRWERILCLSAIAITLWAVMLSASRGGFLGLVAAGLYLIARSRRRAFNLLGVTVLIALALALAPITPIQRFLHPTRGDQQSTQDRLVLWGAGLRMIAAHPLTGIGLDNFKAELPRYMPPGANIDFIAHSTYIEIGASMGLPGLFAFLAILGFTYFSLRRSRVRAQEIGAEWIYLTAAGLEAGMVGFGIAVFFLSAAFLKMLWFTVFISAVLPTLLAQWEGVEDAPAAEPEAESAQASVWAIAETSSPFWPEASDSAWTWQSGETSVWAIPAGIEEPQK